MGRNIWQLYANRRRHPGTTRAGNIGFYTVIGVTIVGLLVLFGLYLLARETLQGLATITPTPPA